MLKEKDLFPLKVMIKKERDTNPDLKSILLVFRRIL